MKSDVPFKYFSTDHCQFDTYKNVASTCMPTGNASGSAVTVCVDMVNRDFASGTTDGWAANPALIGGSGQVTGATTYGNADYETEDRRYLYNFFTSELNQLTLGIQATPVVNPDNTHPGAPAPHIPWDNPTCAVSSPPLKIDPVRIRRSDAMLSAEHMTNHPELFGRIDFRESQTCTATHWNLDGVPELVRGVARMPLRKAMSACAVIPECGGISVNDDGHYLAADILPAEFNTSALHDVGFCKMSEKPVPRIVTRVAGGVGENVWCGGLKWGPVSDTAQLCGENCNQPQFMWNKGNKKCGCNVCEQPDQPAAGDQENWEFYRSVVVHVADGPVRCSCRSVVVCNS